MNRLDLSRRQLLQAGAALGAPLLAPWAVAQKAAQPLPALGTSYPLAAVPLLDGGRFEPAQAEGRALVLYWWASWCPFCAQQSPEMQKLWAAQSGRGLQMLTLSIDKKPEDAAAYLARKIREGSVGEWGRVVMSRHPQINEVQAQAMALWVLGLQPAEGGRAAAPP